MSQMTLASNQKVSLIIDRHDAKVKGHCDPNDGSKIILCLHGPYIVALNI